MKKIRVMRDRIASRLADRINLYIYERYGEVRYEEDIK